MLNISATDFAQSGALSDVAFAGFTEASAGRSAAAAIKAHAPVWKLESDNPSKEVKAHQLSIKRAYRIGVVAEHLMSLSTDNACTAIEYAYAQEDDTKLRTDIVTTVRKRADKRFERALELAGLVSFDNRGGARDGAGAPRKEETATPEDQAQQQQAETITTPDNVPVCSSLKETALALLASGATLEKTGDRNPPALGEGDGREETALAKAIATYNESIHKAQQKLAEAIAKYDAAKANA